jgi:hypothetical protein
MRNGKMTLPAGVAGIGLRQPLRDGEPVAVRLQRARKVAPVIALLIVLTSSPRLPEVS